MMSTNGYNAGPARGSRSKSQLQQDLTKTQERLDKKEIILARCMQKLQGFQIKLEASDDLNTKLLSKDLVGKNVQAKLEALENQKLSLNQQVDTLSAQIAMLRKANDALQKKATEQGQNGQPADILSKA